jgi:phosphoribosyl 1,2-cyclic phosphodiesterase
MKVTFWGVRGSIPAPGPDTNRYGGNTSCVTVQTRAGDLIIIDMGTGMRGLGGTLMSTPFGKGQGEAAILLSHGHWDHIQGFPFFPPIFIPGNRFSIHGPGHSNEMLEGILEGQMNPHFSPIHTVKNLGAQIALVPVPEGHEFELFGLRVRALSNPHGSTQSLAFRLEEAGRTFVYASDVGYPVAGPTKEMLAHYSGVDVLLHDCTYSPEDRAARVERGFSSWRDAADVAVRAKVKHLVMFHYDQDYTDDIVDGMRDRCRSRLDELGGQHIGLTPAAEGLTIEV